jgi:PAS domain S-box-containing protein
MTTASIPPTPEIDCISTREILEGFARLHRLVVVADSRNRIIWMSDAFRDTCNGIERYIGKEWSQLLPPVPRLRHRVQLDSQLQEHQTLNNVRLDLQRGDGSPLSVDVSAFRVESGAEGDPLTVAIVRTVEERERSVRLPRDRGDFFRTVLDGSPDAVLVLDRANFITYANPASEAMLGERPDSLIGKPIALFLPQATGFGKLASAMGPNGETTCKEIELRRRDDETVWVSISTRVLRDAQGEVEGGIAFLRDVTARRRTQEMLERKNGELESYVHSVSHDLRSPLVSLLGFTRLLRQDYQDLLDDTGNHFLDRVEQAGRTMEALIQDLLELSRIGRPGENRTLVDPRAVLLQLQAELKPRLDEQGVTLKLPASPPLVLCDRTRIYQVFSNLLGNALDHMGPCENPQIRVDLSEEPGFHRITVQDNGKGIPPAQHERIFEVFQSLAPRPDGSRSTGIGLAIVKKIAETHGGRVWVEGRQPGRGAIFHLTLPRS